MHDVKRFSAFAWLVGYSLKRSWRDQDFSLNLYQVQRLHSQNDNAGGREWNEAACHFSHRVSLAAYPAQCLNYFRALYQFAHQALSGSRYFITPLPLNFTGGSRSSYPTSPSLLSCSSLSYGFLEGRYLSPLLCLSCLRP